MNTATSKTTISNTTILNTSTSHTTGSNTTSSNTTSSNTTSQRGFTLIELMIVVSIIGILAGVALPSYSDYVTRAKVSEAFALASELKGPIKEYYKAKGRFPTDNDAAGVPAKDKLIGNYVKAMQVSDGAIHITLGNKLAHLLDDKIITLRPIVVDGSPMSPISWVCGHDEIPTGMKAVGANNTDVENVYLPANCRK